MRAPALSRHLVSPAAAAASAAVLVSGGVAHADDPAAGTTTKPPAVSGGAAGKNIYASAASSQIRVIQVSGPTSGKRGAVSSVDVNWKPPACWYEPVFTPEQLKDFSEQVGEGEVSPHVEWWGTKLWTDHYRDEQPGTNWDNDLSTAAGYKDYNVGKGGYFWRGVAPDRTDPDSWDCDLVMFWQPANEIPKVANAPNPKTLADYTYKAVEVPSTEIELRPEAKSTVNLPTWVWLDKGTFQDVKVRAELPKTDLWAETTAKPVALHLNPGTTDATTYPASGDCTINADGSIGTPFTQGNAGKAPPCGIRYLRATDGSPYRLTASITWQITWVGSDGTQGGLPNGVFETTQDVNVQEIQSINR